MLGVIQYNFMGIMLYLVYGFVEQQADWLNNL